MAFGNALHVLILSLLFSTIRTQKPRKTVLITGANRGVGYAATKVLAQTNEWNIVMACRSLNLGEEAKNRIKIGQENCRVVELDLADLSSVRKFGKEFKGLQLDVLACNAGIQMSSGTGSSKGGPKFTKDGFEITVGTNHLGHFALVDQLLGTLEKRKSSRIVFVGSGFHNPDEPGGNVGSKATLGDLSGFQHGFMSPIAMVDGSEYDADKAYKDSKLCNVITSLELARRLAAKRSSVTCNVMNPGLIPTSGLFREINPIFVAVFTFLTRYVFKVAVSEEEGGRRLAYLIDSPALNGVSGCYFSGSPGKSEFGPISPSIEAQDLKKGKAFWELSAKLIKAGLK